MRKYKLMKNGIAMIELIFALVIMGIVLLSAPMLIQQSINSSNIALQQESISALATHMEMILTMYWDEHNTESNKSILDVQRVITPNPFNFNNGNLSGYKNILVNYGNGRTTTIATAHIPVPVSNHIGTDINESEFDDFDDIDDFNNKNFGLILFNGESTTADIGDYVDKDVNISTTVTYNEDRPNNATLNNSTLDINHSISIVIGNPTNIKFITSTLTSDSGVKELEKNITLKAFSCNIGKVYIEGESL